MTRELFMQNLAQHIITLHTIRNWLMFGGEITDDLASELSTYVDNAMLPLDAFKNAFISTDDINDK